MILLASVIYSKSQATSFGDDEADRCPDRRRGLTPLIGELSGVAPVWRVCRRTVRRQVSGEGTEYGVTGGCG